MVAHLATGGTDKSPDREATVAVTYANPISQVQPKTGCDSPFLPPKKKKRPTTTNPGPFSYITHLLKDLMRI